MKKLLAATITLSMLFIIAGCSKKKDMEPYSRSARKTYENKVMYSVLIPFMYENSFYAYYALGKKIDGPDKKGFYRAEFKNGPKEGKVIRTKNIILKVRPAAENELRRGLVVLVNHWDPKEHDEFTRTDMWRKAVVHNLDRLKDGLVMVEFPHDRNDFFATKETYRADNLWIILNPHTTDPRTFL